MREGLLKELASIVGGGERIDISHPQIHQHGIKAGIYILMQMACCDDAVGTSSPWGGEFVLGVRGREGLEDKEMLLFLFALVVRR